MVKVADSEKDKAQKRMQTIASNIVGLGLSMQLTQGGTNNVGLGTNTYQQVSVSHMIILLGPFWLIVKIAYS